VRGSSTFWALLPCLLLPGLAAAEPEQPNLLVLIADDVGWVDLSTGRTNLGNGSKYHETPNLDQLAAEGLSFTAAYAQQNCMPTRASLLTGQYPTRHWVYSVGGFGYSSAQELESARIAPPSGHRDDIFPRAVTLPETLGSVGYRSVVIGKEHGFGPRRQLTRSHGFDVDLSIEKVQWVQLQGKKKKRHYLAGRRANGAWHFARPAYDDYAKPYTQEYVERNLLPFANGNDPLELVGTPKHLTDAIADATIAYIARSATRREPFLALVGFHAVHKPIVPRRDLLVKYAAREKGDLRHGHPAYGALLEGLDQSVGRIVAALDDPNGDGDTADSIAKKTLVVFLSDNGGLRSQTSNAPLRAGKGSFFEGGLRVPMIARQPGVIAPGSRSDEPVHVIDLYPTFMELAGAAPPAERKHYLDGESLVPLLRGQVQNLSRPALFWHFPGYIDTRLAPSSVINRRHEGKRYKLIWSYEREHYSLYDLSTDLGERTDLLAGEPTPEHRVAAERLSRDLRRWIVGLRAPLGWVKAINRPVKPPPRFDASKHRKG
jgi:arylsulfatase A-like enzyme